MWEEECGKDGAEVEILEKDSTQGWGRAELGQKGAWLGLGRGWAWLWVGWSHQRKGMADKDGAVGPGIPRRVSLSSFMAEARLCPLESLS